MLGLILLLGGGFAVTRTTFRSSPRLCRLPLHGRLRDEWSSEMTTPAAGQRSTGCCVAGNGNGRRVRIVAQR